MFEIIFFLLFLFLVSIFFNKKKILPNFTGEIHQKFLSEKHIPLIGGIFILVIIFKVSLSYEKIYYFVFILIYLVGILSDGKFVSSPEIRLIFQVILISYFCYHFKIHVTPTRIEFFDLLFENKFLSLLFSIFCFTILINGSNFIDGLNGLLLGYVLIIIFLLSVNKLIFLSIIEIESLNFLIISIFLVLIFNMKNFFYLGDSGAYVLGLFLGYLLVSIYNQNSNISPYYIILLLWFPCFEILFSMIRKIKTKFSPTKPDNKHLHQLIFLFNKKKFNLSDHATNNYSSIMINFYNLLSLYVGSLNIYNTKFLIFLLIFNITIYSTVYFKLLKLLPFTK